VMNHIMKARVEVLFLMTKNILKERSNLIDDPDYRNILQEMRKKLQEWMEETNDPALRMYEWYLNSK
ncbi:MAG: hypothetical protein ACOCRB_02770, partial [Halanaerobiaceae bacterium]